LGLEFNSNPNTFNSNIYDIDPTRKHHRSQRN
jgi:hypothetical protein